MSLALNKRSQSLVIGTILILAACTVLQQGPVFLSKLASLPVSFVSEPPRKQTADLSTLPKGKYFFSIGRILGSSEIRLNGELLQRSQLYAGLPLEVSNDQTPKVLSVEWDAEESWRDRLFDAPIVTHYGIGFLLQQWRVFTGIFMGPIASLLLLIMALVNIRLSKENTGQIRMHIVLGIVGFFYTLCVSGILDLFFDQKANTFVQVVFRIIFSAAFIGLVSVYSKKRHILLQALHGAALLLFIVIYNVNWEVIIPLYKLELVFFLIATLIATCDLIRSKSDGPEVDTMICLATSMVTIQIFATAIYCMYGATNLTVWSPSYLAVLAIINFYFIYRKAVSHSAEMELSKRQYILASQIAHDVRSPLALLKVLSRDDAMPDDLKSLLVAASDRIRGIADTLLEKNREIKMKQPVSSKVLNPKAQRSNLFELTSKAVEEKRRLTNKVQIHFEHENDAQIFGLVDALEFSRILSNLIDNAIEAVDASGEITIALISESDRVLLSIKDNGKGIPDQMLSKLFEYGATFGKSNGNGLGLYSAKKAIEAWSGTIKINSILGHGSEVVINLPVSDV